MEVTKADKADLADARKYGRLSSFKSNGETIVISSWYEKIYVLDVQPSSNQQGNA